MPQVKKKSFIQKNGLIAVWSMAGFMAMGYIGFLATGSGTNSSIGTVVAQNGSTPSTAARSPVQQEIAALRAHVAELTNREQATSRKLSMIEEALGPNTAALPGPKSGYGIDEVAPGTDSIETPFKSTAKVSVNVLPLTANDKITELSGSNQSDSYGVDLASARSISSLKRHWSYLQKKEPDLLRGLKPHFIDKGTSDLPLFSLVVGPFNRMSDASSHCLSLSKANIECQETRFQMGSMEKIHTADGGFAK
jgi:hypothetical protein